MIKIYFDFTSPYSYLALESADYFSESKFSDIKFCPVMVGSLMSQIGIIGPAEIKAKREYLFKDCLRKADSREIQFVSPGKLPFNPLPMLRFVEALSESREKQVSFIKATFKYGWKSGLDYEDYEAFKKFIMHECGFSSSEYDELDSNRDARRSLKRNISNAIEEGVFGVPSFVFGNEVFWGDDSLIYLREAIKNKDPCVKYENEFLRFKRIINGE